MLPFHSYRLEKRTGLLAVAVLLASSAFAQATTWTPFFQINGFFYDNPGVPITASQAGYSEYDSSWPIFGTALPGTTASPPTWTGALTSAPADLGALQSSATDGAGNTYGLYTITDPYTGPQYQNYISKTTPANVTVYFGIPQAADFVSQMSVTPAGTVYFQIASFPIVYVLNPDGTTAEAVQAIGNIYVPPGFTVDANGDITFSNASFFSGANWGGGALTLDEVFAATGPVPYFPGAITMPSENGNGYPPGVFATVSYPPSSPTYTVPFSANPTIALSIAPATSSLPVTYQWYFDGAAISDATQTSYNGPFLGNGTYSVTASTTAGTVTANATLQLAVGDVPVSAAPVFISSPQSVTINLGLPTDLTASAGSTLPVAFQWFLNGTAIPGADSSTQSPTTEGLYNTIYTTDQPGVYTVVATTIGSGGGSLTSSPANLSVTWGGLPVTQVPTIVAPPQSTVFTYGGSLPNLSVFILATLPATYQWQMNGVPIPGATQSTYSTGVPGTYTVVVTTTAGSVTSNPAVVTMASRPVNISTRALVGTGADVCIAGFVVSSYSGAPKQLLIRAVGPSLSEFNVPGVLARPVLTVFDSSGSVVASNSGWNNSPTIAAAESAVGAFAFPAGSADSALLLDLPPGSYTAQVTGEDGTTGVALVEAYEVTADGGHLIDISTRASVGTGADVLIAGFVIGGTQASQLLIRGIGPGLAQFGVSDPLAQPVLSVYDSGGNLVGLNVGWSNGSSADAVAVANAASAAGAFALIPGSADSAVCLTLPPGQYTAEVTGVDGTTGAALVEVYQVP